jgi:predicted ester cyclase
VIPQFFTNKTSFMPTIIEQQQELSLKNACVSFMFAYQQRNVDKMLSFCDPSGEVFFKPLGESGKGKIMELGKAIWTSLIDCFPDIDNTVDAAIAEDGESVRCQVVIRGTQAKDFAGIVSKGKHFDSDHIFIFRLNPAGKIVRIEVEWDHEDFKRQLGAA